jgi:hexosaminidase
MSTKRTNLRSFAYFSFLLMSSVLFSCGPYASDESKQAFQSVIPKPSSLNIGGKKFVLSTETSIQFDQQNSEVKNVVDNFRAIFSPATGFKFPENSDSETQIKFELTNQPDLKNEGYELTISTTRILIQANKAAGLFYGVQTLRQLLPEKIESHSVQQTQWEVVTGTIRDVPQYEWRGSMLDVARHFFSVEDVKRYVDLISIYKMNRLHLHLSDDQGWRIEIKSWPNLTAIGGTTQVGGGKGGFYTQEQYKEMVDYAAKRFVTIIPEIDLPGHINAALASYAELNMGPRIGKEGAIANPAQGSQELNAKPVPGKLYTGIEVGFSTLDYKKEVTFKFVEDVIRELSQITSGPYIHIGGDEAAVTKKEDYINFIGRFKEIVKANGKTMIGWEEIAQGDIDSTVISQYWHSQEYTKMAADKGAKLIFSPSKKVYLDMQYDSATRIGLHWAAYIEVDSSYQWSPDKLVDGIDPKQILGVEAPLWSETVVTMDDIEYLAFPRLPGVAEIGWTGSDRNWDEYKKRLARQSKRWRELEIDYYPSSLIQWVN